jgi:hypothetical protein
MGQTPGDDKQGPSLELPDLALPGFGRRKRSRRRTSDEDEQAQAPTDGYVEPPTDGYVEQPAAEPAAPEAPSTYEPTEPLVEHDQPTHEATTPLPDTSVAAAPETPRRRRRPKRDPLAAPAVPGRIAAAVTGLLVGAAGGAGTYGALAGCEAVRGVSTCGGAPGFFILVAILAHMVLLGAQLLKAFRVEAPGSTSILAVGLVTLVSMLQLLDVIYSPWMFVVIPLLGSVSYLLAHWVTTRFDDEPTDIRR